VEHGAEPGGERREEDDSEMTGTDDVAVGGLSVEILTIDIETQYRADGYNLRRQGRRHCHEGDEKNSRRASLPCDCHGCIR
jgi:hypothetical protein